jgi:hypothetical protein
LNVSTWRIHAAQLTFVGIMMAPFVFGGPRTFASRRSDQLYLPCASRFAVTFEYTGSRASFHAATCAAVIPVRWTTKCSVLRGPECRR